MTPDIQNDSALPDAKNRAATSIGGWAYAGLAVGFLILLVIAGVSLWSQARAAEDIEWVRHTQNVQLMIARLGALAADAETGQRGYIITGNDRYLAPFNSAEAELKTTLDALREITNDDSSQQERLTRTEGLIAAKLAELRETIALRREQGVGAAMQLVLTDRGQDDMERLRESLKEMISTEEDLLAKRRAEASASTRLTAHLMFAGMGLIIALGIAVVVKMNRDIRAGQAVAARLESTAAFQAAILESADHAVIAMSLDGAITEFNRAAERMLGYTSDEVAGKSKAELLHDRTELAQRARELSRQFGRTITPGFEALVAKAREGGRDEQEWTFIRRDGSRFPVQVSQTPLRGKTGELIGFLGIAQDITERRAAEQALRESEQRFKQLAENIEEVFWITSADARNVLYVSPAYERIWERKPESLYAKPTDWVEALHPEDHDRVVRAFYEKAPRGEFDEEYRIVGNGGRIRWVHSSGAVVRNAAGEVCRIAGVTRDVTERRCYEEDLKEAKQRADEANRTKSQFLAAMSHELRTPLHGVIGMIDLLGDTGLDARQGRFLEACRTSARSLLELINDVLDLSKVEAGKLVLDNHEFGPDQVVEDAVRLIAMRAQEKGLELVCSVDENVCRTVRGDSTRLRQVLVNLLGNAVKFTPSGSVVASARLQSADGRIAVVRFDVSDSGIGIPPNRLDHLFTPFTQVDASTTRRFGGSGLGLSICKTLIEAMGGCIGAQSQEGVGSSFWFTVPFEESPESQRRIGIPDDLQRLRALVVSDNPPLRDALHRQLTSFGLTARIASPGNAALEQLCEAARSNQPFDLVIADRTLLDMEGLQLAKAIRKNPLLVQTQIFVLTAFHDFTDDRDPCARRLHKPVCRSELLNAIIEQFCSSSEDLRDLDLKRPAEATPSISAHAGKVRILLAEDNSINQMFAREVLRQGGLDCDSVTNGAEAVNAVQRRHYDLILMDCHMPEVDGFEATCRIRQLEKERANSGGAERRIPIIALTANAVKGDQDRCLSVGMDGYVTKPFEAYELIGAIDNVLGRQVTGQDVDQSAADEQGKLGHGAPIDTELLIARCMGNAEFAVSLLDEMEKTGANRVRDIARHAAAGNTVAAAEAAHSLKGAAGIIAAEPLRAIAAEIEAAGKSGRLEDIAVAVDQLRQEMERCLAFVPQFRKQAATIDRQRSNRQQRG